MPPAMERKDGDGTVAGEVRAVDRVATQYGVSWPTVQRLISAAARALATQRRHRPRLVTRLGIDEHRFRSVRWFKNEAGSWQRVEPWMITFVDLANGEVLDVADGRNSAAVSAWLAAQPPWWRRRVQVVAIDPSAAFRPAVRRWLPKARVRAAGGVVEHDPGSVVRWGSVPPPGASDVLDGHVPGFGLGVRGTGLDEGLDLGPPRVDGLLQRRERRQVSRHGMTLNRPRTPLSQRWG